MSFDARSRERLAALGRQLPRKLDPPEPPPRGATAGRPEAPRHAVETEQDPEQLFRDLMGASADGTVPPHLLERLRVLEQQRRPGGAGRATGGPATTPAAGPAQGATGPEGASARRAQPPSRRPGSPAVRRLQEPEHQELYTAFQQLLLEDDGLD